MYSNLVGSHIWHANWQLWVTWGEFGARQYLKQELSWRREAAVRAGPVIEYFANSLKVIEMVPFQLP